MPSGAWHLAFRYDGCAALDLELQVQRDDSLVGYRAGARQSYFESPEGYGWNQEFFDYTQLGPDCAIKYAGSHNALATALTRQVFHVGAVRRDVHQCLTTTEVKALDPQDVRFKQGEWVCIGGSGWGAGAANRPNRRRAG